MCTNHAVLILAGAVLLASQTATGQRFSPATHEAEFAGAFLQGMTPPQWGGPFLLSWRHSTTNVDTGDNLVLYGRDGRIGAKARLGFPDAHTVRINGASGSSRSGQAVFAGQALGDSGYVAGFFALVDAGGRVTRTVRTAPFEPMAVALGPDDSIWLFGCQTGWDRQRPTAPPHATVRRYGNDGKLLAEYLPNTEWKCSAWPHPAADLPLLVASADRIGVISNACWDWAEFTAQGEFIARRSLPPIPGKTNTGRSIIAGAAMTSTGLFARFGNPGHLCRLSRGGDAWQIIDVSAPGRVKPDLLGADGDSLVLCGGRGKVHWANVIE